MGGIVAILVLIVPPLIASDVIDSVQEYARKRRFQRKMQARRGCNYTYN